MTPTPQQLDLFDPRRAPDADRPQKIAALLNREKWRVDECAYYLRCGIQHIYDLILDGSVAATNIARDPNTRPLYRVMKDSILAFEKSRLEGAPEEAGTTTQGK